MILYAKIRRMYFRDQLSINEIVRRTSLSRNTVKKWLRMPNGSEPAYQRRSMPTKLTLYEDQLKQALIADSYRPKRDRRTALKLLEELQQVGYDGGYAKKLMPFITLDKFLSGADYQPFLQPFPNQNNSSMQHK